MATTTTWLGEWWLPGDPDRRVPGNISITDDDGAELEIFGTLADGDGGDRFSVVLGRTLEGGPVTLEDVELTGSNQRSSQWLEEPVSIRRFSARVAYVGEELPEASDRVFRVSRLGFTDLPDWISGGRFYEHIQNLPRVDLSYEPPPDITARLGFGTVSIRQGWATSGDAVRSRKIERTVEFQVATYRPLTMSEWLSEVVRPLRHFMTFATERANEVTSLTFTPNSQEDDPVGHQIVAHYSRASVIAPSEPARRWEMLIEGAETEAQLPALLGKWFDLTTRTSLVIDRLLAPRYRPVTFIENRFLDVVGAAEGYHRATQTNALLPKAAHRLRVAAVVDRAPQEHQDWLKEKLANSNEPSLRERLIELCASVSEIVTPAIDAAPVYVKSVVEARNSVTHAGTKKRPTPGGFDLWRLTEQTTLLVTACMLKDLGFDDERASQAIRRTRRFRLLTEAR